MSEIMIKNCPSCGAPVGITANICGYCGSAYYVETISSLITINKKGITKYIEAYKKAIAENGLDLKAKKALGICYMKLGMYDFANKQFEAMIQDDIDDADIYLYSAVCLLKGKRPFLTPLTVIREIETRLEAASIISPGSSSYYYAQALIKDDYYKRKFLKASPSAEQLYEEANSYNLSDLDKKTVDSLFNL